MPDFCGDEQDHERHEWTDGPTLRVCPGAPTVESLIAGGVEFPDVPVRPGPVPAERGPSGTGHDTAGWSNVPAKPVKQTSAGICGMHGSFVGRACPKCVTQPKGLS